MKAALSQAHGHAQLHKRASVQPQTLHLKFALQFLARYGWSTELGAGLNAV